MNMTLTRKRFSIGLLFGVIIFVAIGYSRQLPTMTANPFAEHINQIESHIRSLISQIVDLQSQLPLSLPIAVVP